MRLGRISIHTLERQLTTLAARVDEIVPPPPAITTSAEAAAVRRFLAAHVQAHGATFWRHQKGDAALLATVAARGGVPAFD